MSDPLSRLVDLDEAIATLAGDGLLAFPTETVWGLAARSVSPLAVRRLQAFKGRASRQPISVLVDAPARLAELGVRIDGVAPAVIEAFWPGPLTIVLPGSDASGFAPGIGGETGAVGFRCSDHAGCAALVAGAFEAGLGAITATSFNRSGEPPVQTKAEALGLATSDPEADVRCLEPGPHDALGEEPSTVIDLSLGAPRVLRWGAIGAAALEAVVPQLEGVRAQE